MPTPEDCQYLKLRAGETEFITVTETGTETDAQYQLDLVKIYKKETKVSKADELTHEAESLAKASSAADSTRKRDRYVFDAEDRHAAAQGSNHTNSRREPMIALRRALCPPPLVKRPRRMLAVPLHVVTAGESHGPGLTTIVEGLPAGLELDQEAIDGDMARRQLGHGRGGRMKIEKDSAQVTAGVRHGRTLGGPIALQVANRDFKNWEERMNPWPVEADVPEVHLPRPGHADLAGAQKFGFTDIRNVLERASARETAARVAGGALAKAFLSALGVTVRLARDPDRVDQGAGV